MLVDIQRIEVLKWPPGHLVRRECDGGAIRFITHKPDLSRREGFVAASVSPIKQGSTGYEFNGMFNVPLHDGQAAVRAVGYHRDRYAYVDNPAVGDKNVNNNAISGRQNFRNNAVFDNASLTGTIVYQDRQSDGADIEAMNQAPHTIGLNISRYY